MLWGWCLFCSNCLLGCSWYLCLKVPCKYEHVIGVFILEISHGGGDGVGDVFFSVVFSLAFYVISMSLDFGCCYEKLSLNLSNL